MSKHLYEGTLRDAIKLRFGLEGPILNITDNQHSALVVIEGDIVENEKNVAVGCIHQCVAQDIPVVVIEKEKGYFVEKATTTYVTEWVTICPCSTASPDLFHGMFLEFMKRYIHMRNTIRPLEMIVSDTAVLLADKEPQEELGLMLRDIRTRNTIRPLVVIIDDAAAFLQNQQTQESFDLAIRNAREKNIFFIALWKAPATDEERNLFQRYQAHIL